MHSKIIFALLSAFVWIDLSAANKEAVAVMCSLTRENSLWVPVGNRQCITGCFGDPKNHPIIVLNKCRPPNTLGAVKEYVYKGIHFLVHINSYMRTAVKNKLTPFR